MVRAVALVGSWARGSATMGSDIDVVLVTSDPGQYIDGEDWAVDLGARAVVRTRRWGVLTERRLRLPSALEVDVGVVPPLWADPDPIGAGTSRVVADGLVPLYDPHGVLVTLMLATFAELTVSRPDGSVG